MTQLLPFENFLTRHFVFSMAVISDEKPYSAPCFYVYVPKDKEMIFVSDSSSKHIKAALANLDIAGSVYLETEVVQEIQGVQFCGRLVSLSKEEMKDSCRLFCDRFPYARVKDTPVWRLRLNWIKFTDHTRGFGFKELWPT